MKKTQNHPIAITILFLTGFLLLNYGRNELLKLIADDGIIITSTKYFITALFNVVYTVVSYWLIKKYNLINLAGLGKTKLKNWFLLLFPLYVVLINSPDPGEIDYSAIPMINYVAVIVWVLSIGYSEEFMMRGFMQSLFLKKYATSKTKIVAAVIGPAFVFGLLHLVKFDKGLYGEIAQVLYATFIGTMFGALLLRTNKIWPLIVLHALIDFVGNLEKFQNTETILNLSSSGTATIEDSLGIILFLLPCFIYGLILLLKVKLEDVQAKVQE